MGRNETEAARVCYPEPIGVPDPKTTPYETIGDSLQAVAGENDGVISIPGFYKTLFRGSYPGGVWGSFNGRVLPLGFDPKDPVAFGQLPQMKFSPQDEIAIQENWEITCQTALRRGRKLTNGPVVSLAGWYARNGMMFLDFQAAHYADYLWGGKVLNDDERQKRNWAVPNGLAAVSLIYSSRACDGKGGILLSQRARNLPVNPGFLDVAGGGSVDIKEDRGERFIDLIATVRREGSEETGIGEEHLLNPRIISAVVEQGSVFGVTFVGLVDLSPRVDLDSIGGDGENRPFWVPAEPHELGQLVMSKAFVTTPITVATLIEFLLERYPETKMPQYNGQEGNLGQHQRVVDWALECLRKAGENKQKIIQIDALKERKLAAIADRYR